MPVFKQLIRLSLAAILSLACHGFLLAQQSPRFPQLKLEETQGDQKVMAERVIKETRVGMGGPWNVALRSPGLAESVMSLYTFYRTKTVLKPNQMEFVIMLVTREWNTGFQWATHYPIAINDGVPASLLADIRARKRPAQMEPIYDALYDFSTELLRQHTVSNATFDKTKRLIGEQGAVDLTGLVGTYSMLASILNVGEVAGPKSGGPEFLPVP